MGTDKALVELAGRPLIAHTTAKLRRLTPRVHILSANQALSPYAPLVGDLHPNTGPIGGVEAALAHTSSDWNLIYPVDVPFVPTAFLAWWVRTVTQLHAFYTRVALFRIDDVAQPALLLIHRDALPIIREAVLCGDYKLYPVLQKVARELAPPGAQPWETVPYLLPIDETLQFGAEEIAGGNPEPWQLVSEEQRRAQGLWFANLNTPEDLAQAKLHVNALDT